MAPPQWVGTACWDSQASEGSRWAPCCWRGGKTPSRGVDTASPRSAPSSRALLTARGCSKAQPWLLLLLGRQLLFLTPAFVGSSNKLRAFLAPQGGGSACRPTTNNFSFPLQPEFVGLTTGVGFLRGQPRPGRSRSVLCRGGA